jgi:hypothetical protein
MKSIMSKVSIIMLSLLVSTYTFAFDHGDVCEAMNAAVTSYAKEYQGAAWGSLKGPINSIFTRNTDASDPRGEACGTIPFTADAPCLNMKVSDGQSECNSDPNKWPQSHRVCGQSGLECSGDTCHVNKEWDDCECTSNACRSG